MWFKVGKSKSEFASLDADLFYDSRLCRVAADFLGIDQKKITTDDIIERKDVGQRGFRPTICLFVANEIAKTKRLDLPAVLIRVLWDLEEIASEIAYFRTNRFDPALINQSSGEPSLEATAVLGAVSGSLGYENRFAGTD